MKKDNLFDLSMFMLRFVLGTIFIVHGAQKLFGMFGGVGLDVTVKMLEAFSLPNPQIFALMWAGIEFVGGVFLLFGILARWSASAIALTVVVQLFGMNLAYGFLSQNGSIEYNLLVFASCLPVILLGGGSWSVWDV